MTSRGLTTTGKEGRGMWDRGWTGMAGGWVGGWTGRRTDGREKFDARANPSPRLPVLRCSGEVLLPRTRIS